jgi:hypothetical protein
MAERVYYLYETRQLAMALSAAFTGSGSGLFSFVRILTKASMTS